MTHFKTATRIFVFLALAITFAPGLRAQTVTRVNPAHITLRAVSMSSLWTGIMVGDSNYVAITHDAYDVSSISQPFTALQTPFAHSTTLYAVAYAGDTSHAVIAGENGSLAWTSDGGTTWTPYALGTSVAIRAVTWNQSTASPVLVGVGDGGLVIRSKDQGQTWKTETSPTTAQLNAIAFGSATEAVAVGNDTTMIQSHDGGQTWSPMTFPYNFHTWDTGYYENKMGAINLSGVAMDGKDSVWVCFDTAMVPLLVCQGEAADTSTEFFDQLFGQGNLPISWGPLLTYPTYSSVLYVGMPGVCLISTGNNGDFIYYTVDYDSSIHETGLDGIGDANGTKLPLSVRIRAQGLWKQDTNYIILLAGDDLSLYQVLGSPYAKIRYTRGFPPYPGKDTRAEFLAVSTLPSGFGYTAAPGDVFQRTTDGGRTWTYITLPVTDSAIDNVYTLDTSTALIVGYSGMILRDDPTGYHFLPSGTTERLESIAFPSQDTGIIVGDFGTVLQSSDRGETWKAISRVPTTERLYSVAFANNNIGIATGDSATILRTTDEGVTWTSVNNLLTGTNISLPNVQAFPNGTFLANARNDLLRSTDFGENWTSILPTGMSDTCGMGFYSPQIGMIAQRSTSSQLVPDTAHLAYTTDGGSTWTPFTVPFWNDSRIIFNWLNDHEALIYGSFGFIDDIVFGTSSVQVTQVDNNSSIQLFPNPSSGNINILYSTKTNGPVTIELWDESGKKIQQLFSGEESAGSHQQAFTLPQDLHGAFFIRLSADGAMSTTKLNIQ